MRLLPHRLVYYRQAFLEFLEKKIQAEGAISITKDSGLISGIKKEQKRLIHAG